MQRYGTGTRCVVVELDDFGIGFCDAHPCKAAHVVQSRSLKQSTQCLILQHALNHRSPDAKLTRMLRTCREAAVKRCSASPLQRCSTNSHQSELQAADAVKTGAEHLGQVLHTTGVYDRPRVLRLCTQKLKRTAHAWLSTPKWHLRGHALSCKPGRGV